MAATVVQQCWRNRKVRRLLALFPSMKVLKDQFIDEDARAAGADDNPLYSGAALKARELCYHHPEVVSALSFAWRAIAYRKGKATPLISRGDYLVMMRKLVSEPSVAPVASHDSSRGTFQALTACS